MLNAADVKLNNLTSSVGEIEKDASSLSIYPNPTADVSTIEFNLSTSKAVLLSVRDMTGKEVIVKDFGTLSAGVQKIAFDATNLTNGIYFASMKIGEEVITKKLSVNR